MKRLIEKMIVEFEVELVKDEKNGGYSGSMKDYPIIAEGDTKEETIQNLEHTFLIALNYVFK